MSFVTASFDARCAAAFRLAQGGDPAQAVALFAALLRERPELPLLRHALVRGLLLGGAPERALAEALHPTLLDAQDVFRATVAEFAAAGAEPQRVALLRARLQRHPRSYGAAVSLAVSMHAAFRPSEALRWCEHALALRPLERTPKEIRATALIDRGDVEAGLAVQRELLRHGDASIAARHLVLMHYDPA